MQIKLSDIYSVMSSTPSSPVSAIGELMSLRPNPSPQVSYWFGKMVRLFTDEFADINLARSGIIEQLGAKDKDGNTQIQNSDTEGIASYVEQLNAVLEEKADLPLRKIKVSELGDEFPITIELQARFYFMIDGEEEPAA